MLIEVIIYEDGKHKRIFVWQDEFGQLHRCI